MDRGSQKRSKSDAIEGSKAYDGTEDKGRHVEIDTRTGADDKGTQRRGG